MEWTHHSERVNGIRLHFVQAGQGPPLYLLHGYPQSWFMWRKVIPLLAHRYSLVVPDMRGYGDSDKPQAGYDKRTMAADIRELARRLGHDRFGLAGHDRGARVAHRYALDHGETLAGVSLLDIAPTKTIFDTLDKEGALGSWHWLFLPVPDLAETLIAGNPEAYLRYMFRGWALHAHAIEEEALQEYLRAFRIPGTIRATCADYAAGAGIDLEHDGADADQRIEAPLQVLWGDSGRLPRRFDLIKVWREKARLVRGQAIEDCGHFLAEEQPQALAKALETFFGEVL